MPMTGDCVGDIRAIIEKARKGVVRHVNSTMTLAYWLIGRRIVVEEQGGKDRAEYGWHLMERISRELTDVYCRGFGVANLRNFREFYLQNPSEKAIRYALRSELGWTHHRAIIRVADPKARSYYLDEAVAQGWSTRDLEREIRMRTYERVIGNHGASVERGVVYAFCEMHNKCTKCTTDILRNKHQMRKTARKTRGVATKSASHQHANAVAKTTLQTTTQTTTQTTPQISISSKIERWVMLTSSCLSGGLGHHDR